MTNFTPEMIEKAKTAKTAEELLALAKENGVEMTEEEAKLCFAQLDSASGELDDEELANVAGGGCKKTVAETFELGDLVRIRSAHPYKCEKCDSRTGSFIRYNNNNWGVMCGSCNNGTLIILADGSSNPAAIIEKV